MSFVLADRVKETSTSTGVGDMTLAGAETGYQSFAVIGDGNSTYYTIALQGGNEWEVGIGTYESTGPDLQRDVVLCNLPVRAVSVCFGWWSDCRYWVYLH
jgi:hypothetical protein